MTFSDQEKVQQLEQMVADDPEDFLGFFMLGKLYLDLERFDDAAAALESTLRIKPDYSAAWRLCGDAYRRAGNNPKAAEVYRKGIIVAEENRDLQTVKEMQVFLRKVEE